MNAPEKVIYDEAECEALGHEVVAAVRRATADLREAREHIEVARESQEPGEPFGALKDVIRRRLSGGEDTLLGTELLIAAADLRSELVRLDEEDRA